jgi:hypothetical protein
MDVPNPMKKDPDPEVTSSELDASQALLYFWLPHYCVWDLVAEDRLVEMDKESWAHLSR